MIILVVFYFYNLSEARVLDIANANECFGFQVIAEQKNVMEQ